MPTCEHCQNNLLDYLYGVLDENEAREIREHLVACEGCRAILEKAQAQQDLLARAARVIRAVPEFALPTDASTPLPQSSLSVSEPAGVAPAGLSQSPRRPLLRRPWVAWSAAAALLVAVSAAISGYRSTLHGYQQELTQRRKDKDAVELLIASLPTKYRGEQHAALHGARAEAPPHLHVVGPATLQPGAVGTLHVTTRQSDGALANAKLNVKLVDAKTHRLVQETNTDCEGQARVEVRALADALAFNDLNLVVEAKTLQGTARVGETVRVRAPTFVSRIDIDKNVYAFKDVLLFRVLVLDRFTLRPPTQPILMNVALLGPDGAVARHFPLWTGAGGILAGEFPIDEKLRLGRCTLLVSAFDNGDDSLRDEGAGRVALGVANLVAGSAAPAVKPFLVDLPALLLGRTVAGFVQSAKHSFDVVGVNVNTVQLEQNRYRAGEMVSGFLPDVPAAGGRSALQATASINGKSVPIKLEEKAAMDGVQALADKSKKKSVGGGGATPEARGGVANAANNNNLLRFSARMPANIPPGASNVPLNIQLNDGEGKAKKEYSVAVPLQATEYAIDFFPEGGELIVGIPNRVFYRVRASNGDPVVGDGSVVLLTGKSGNIDSRYQLGLGYFDFTPNTKESYRVRIAGPMKTTELAKPFADLRMRSSGVVLHLPVAVGKQGEPIRVTLRNQGPPRKLLLVAQCRGQIVEERWIDAKTGSDDFTLQPSADVHGMIRVTVYEVENSVLEPIAERLAFRSPLQRLDLGVALNTQQFAPGQQVSAKLTAKTEKGDPAQAWILAAIVDERFQAQPRSLSAHFLLLNEIQAGDGLENAPLILNDSPGSAQMLERFLGTYGWRRFVRNESIAPVGADQARTLQENRGLPLVFSRESMPLETLKTQDENKLAQAVAPLREAAFREQVELSDRHLAAASAVRSAALQLQAFEDGMQLLLRLGLGFLVAVLMFASLVLMCVGTYRILRQHRSATPAFGSAFAGLVACFVVMLAGSYLGPMESSNAQAPDRVASVGDVQRELTRIFAEAPSLQKGMRNPAPVGLLALGKAGKDADTLFLQAAPQETRSAAQGRSQTASKAESEQLTMDRVERSTNLAAAVEMQRRALANMPLAGGSMQAKDSVAPGAFGGAGIDEKFKAAPAPPAPAGAAVPGAAPRLSGPANKAMEFSTTRQNLREADSASSQRQYAYQYVPNLGADTLLWAPSLSLTDGTGMVRFDIPGSPATYRVIVLGHTSTGRFGFYEKHIDVVGR